MYDLRSIVSIQNTLEFMVESRNVDGLFDM